MGGQKRLLILRQLYTKLYPEVLQRSGSVELFVKAIWELLNGGKLPGVSDDQVRSILRKGLLTFGG